MRMKNEYFFLFKNVLFSLFLNLPDDFTYLMVVCIAITRHNRAEAANNSHFMSSSCHDEIAIVRTKCNALKLKMSID